MKRITNKTILRCIDDSHDGFLITSPEGEILYVNKAYKKLTRLGELAAEGKNFHELFLEGYVPAEPTCLLAVQKRETVIRVHDWRQAYIVSTSEPFYDVETGEIQLIVTTVRDVPDFFELRDDIEHIQKLVKEVADNLTDYTDYGSGIVARNETMRNLLSMAARVAVYDAPVLLLGESGSGKEVLAHFVHEHSLRRDKPFLAINCAAIPEQLLESELFGYAEGTFTGQLRGGKKGLFGEAHGGTLFLDELGDMSMELQSKILRVLETKMYTPVGSHKQYETDVRIISATNRDLEKKIADGEFRQDLYYRLNVVKLNIPPLRERPEDIIPLCMLFLERNNQKYHMQKHFSAEALSMLMNYDWPGNVREVRNMVEMMFAVSQGDTLKVPELIFKKEQKKKESVVALEPLDVYMGNTEREYLQSAYRQCGSTRRMAETLQIDHSTVIRKMKRYGINATRNSGRRTEK